MSKYLYCINDMEGEDFITTSFICVKELINIFNFDQEFDITRVKYVAIDYTMDPFTSFNRRYTNSNALEVFRVKFLNQDIDRMTVTLLKLESIKSFDLQSYKRDIKIGSIINE